MLIDCTGPLEASHLMNYGVFFLFSQEVKSLRSWAWIAK